MVRIPVLNNGCQQWTESKRRKRTRVLYCILKNILLVYICLWFCCMLLYTTVMFGLINIFCFYIALVFTVYLLPVSADYFHCRTLYWNVDISLWKTKECLHGISKHLLLWKKCLPFDANASFWHVFMAFWMQCYILKEMWGIVHFVCAFMIIVCIVLKKGDIVLKTCVSSWKRL